MPYIIETSILYPLNYNFVESKDFVLSKDSEFVMMSDKTSYFLFKVLPVLSQPDTFIQNHTVSKFYRNFKILTPQILVHFPIALSWDEARSQGLYPDLPCG